jgi:two-component system cell cycle response regulator
MISLKLKLGAYFVVLALLPLAAGYWTFSSTLTGNVQGRADERLTAELRAASAAYDGVLAEARAEAAELAKSPALHAALKNGDRAAVERAVGDRPGIRVRTADGLIGAPVTGASATRITVRDRDGVLGELLAVVPLDQALQHELATRAGLAGRDQLLLAHGSRIALGPHAGAWLPVPANGRDSVVLRDERLRVAAAATAGEEPVTLGVATPQESIDAPVASARRRVLIGVLASLLLISLVGYVEGLAIVRTIGRFVSAAQSIARGRLDERVPVRTRDEFAQLGDAFNEMADELAAQRHRLQLATLRFGEALAATHDIDQLLRVIVTTAVEATRATGGVIRGESGDIARTGEEQSERDTAAIAHPLAVVGESFGTLVIYGERFESDDHEVVASLAAHAVTALENARLHQIVKRQALLDSLTGMPNRRQCESALATELSQAHRFGSALAFVLADLDEFKAVNDQHGHLAGDRVLREFSDILRELTRDADLAARWGGEEFALVLPGTDEEGARVLVERIRSTLEHRTIEIDGRPVAITASFGVAFFPEHPDSAQLIAAADEALYVAKRGGRNRVETARRLPLRA